MKIRSDLGALLCIALAAPAATLAQDITPVSVTASSTFYTYAGQHLIDDSGLSGGLHDSDYRHMWMADTNDVTPWLVFDLGRTCSLTGARIWQYNYYNRAPRGVNGLSILLSNDGSSWTPATTATLAAASPPNPEAAQDVALTGTARYVRFEVTSNHGDPEYTGLSEVKFSGTALLTMTKTVGTTAGVCATTSAITVAPGTTVYYCYTVTNSGPTSLGLHDLTDSALGTLLTGHVYTLASGGTIDTVTRGLSFSAVINTGTTNSATWTAYNTGPVDTVQAVASATVNVDALDIALEKTVGTSPGVCATSSEITVPPGTTVYYCYSVFNDSMVTVDSHDLTDSELGTLFTGRPHTLNPGKSIDTVAMGLTFSAVINTTTTNTATWTVHATGTTATDADTNSATVTVAAPSIPLLDHSGVLAMAGLLALAALWVLARRR